MPCEPELTLTLVERGAVLSWDVKATGWRVEMSTDLRVWQPAPAAVVDEGDFHIIALPAVPRAFFRLWRMP